MKYGVKTAVVFLMLGLYSAANADLVYLADVNINGRNFKDIITLSADIDGNLIIKKVQNTDRRVNGTFTVPGAFTSNFEARYDTVWRPIDSPAIRFSFVASEGGKSFPVSGVLVFQKSRKHLKGSIIIGEGATQIEAPVDAILLEERTK